MKPITIYFIATIVGSIILSAMPPPHIAAQVIQPRIETRRAPVAPIPADSLRDVVNNKNSRAIRKSQRLIEDVTLLRQQNEEIARQAKAKPKVIRQVVLEPICCAQSLHSTGNIQAASPDKCGEVCSEGVIIEKKPNLWHRVTNLFRHHRP